MASGNEFRFFPTEWKGPLERYREAERKRQKEFIEMVENMAQAGKVTVPVEVHLHGGSRVQTNFNNEYTQVVMERVFMERRRQMKLGRAGSIPWACEDPMTDMGTRLGVLGEEFGECCKAHIEEQSIKEHFDEFIQTAAVAVACAEAMARILQINPDSVTEPDEGNDAAATAQYVSELNKDEHWQILAEAHALYVERNQKYKDVWRSYGWRGCLVHMRTCAERAWRVAWLIGDAAKAEDNLIDLINYAVFTIRNIRAENAGGEWEWED